MKMCFVREKMEATGVKVSLFFFRLRMCCLVSGDVNLKKDSSSASDSLFVAV